MSPEVLARLSLHLWHFAQKRDITLLRPPQRVMKEKPRNKLRVPPNSATSDVQGYTGTSVHTVVSLDTAQKEMVKWSDWKEVGCFSPITSYFLYLQGFLHPVSSLKALPSATLMSWYSAS